MENVFAIVYCDGDILSSSKVVLFECPSCSKFITISENMLQNFSYPFCHQPVYVGDSCVEYECVKLKHNDDVEKIKGLIELNATFGLFANEILVLLHKPRKLRSTDEIIALMHDKFV
ncbi:hypothetical protein GmHk_14G040700 [Glycine max]|nr:hypothetical protein GmHk_14G040700 [Glycine max]